VECSKNTPHVGKEIVLDNWSSNMCQQAIIEQLKTSDYGRYGDRNKHNEIVVNNVVVVVVRI
jgi:hypothetical protein